MLDANTRRVGIGKASHPYALMPLPSRDFERQTYSVTQAEASVGYFQVKRWVPTNQHHLTAELHGGLTEKSDVAKVRDSIGAREGSAAEVMLHGQAAVYLLLARSELFVVIQFILLVLQLDVPFFLS